MIYKNTRLKICILKKNICFIAIILCMIISECISYYNVDWVYDRWDIWVRLARNDITSIVLSIAPIMVLLYLLFFKISKINRFLYINSIILLLVCCIWTAYTVFDEGFTNVIYNRNAPYVYLSILSIYVTYYMNDINFFKKGIVCISTFYIFFFIIDFIQISIKAGFFIPGNSSLIYNYTYLFWCIVIWIGLTTLKCERISTIQYIMIFFLIAFSLVIRSRSWLIQSCILLVITILYSFRGIGLSKKIYLITMMILLCLFFFYLINNYLYDFMNSFIEKIGTDSRSNQYFDIFTSTSVLQWLSGKGMNATYLTGGVEYRAIDNQYLYIMFHYGIVMLISYLFPFIFVLKELIKDNLRQNWFVVCIIFMWLMALGGLSVYNGLNLDIKNVLIGMFLGQCICIVKRRRENL